MLEELEEEIGIIAAAGFEEKLARGGALEGRAMLGRLGEMMKAKCTWSSWLFEAIARVVSRQRCW